MKVRKASCRRNYPLKRIFFFLFLKCFVICGFGQDLSTLSLQFGKGLRGFSAGNVGGILGNNVDHLRRINSYKEESAASLYELKLLIWFERNSDFREDDFLAKNVISKKAFFPLEDEKDNSASLQPAWINPDPGYLSYLCRKELEIEKKSPVAFWFQIGEDDPAFLRHKRGGAVSSFKLKFRIN